MNLWWTEEQAAGLRLSLRCNRVLEVRRSPYQEIAVYDTECYGRLLALDDVVMTSEVDEFTYHEMLVHPALAVRGGARRVLVVGGGDGGAVREVLRHPGVERVVLAELDGDVVDVCRRHLPFTAAALADPRVEVRLGDGVAFVAQAPAGAFDVVVVDAPDPVGPAVGLFEEDFYAQIARVLAPDGVVAAQTESPLFQADLIRRVQGALRRHLPVVGLYWAVVPTYPGGFWTFSVASKDPAAELATPRVGELPGTRYWTPAVHRAAFVLPPFLARLLDGTAPAAEAPAR